MAKGGKVSGKNGKTAAKSRFSGNITKSSDTTVTSPPVSRSIDTDKIRQHGFESAQQLKDYVDWDNSRKQVKGRTKEAPVTVEDGSFLGGKNKAVIRAKHSGIEAENFVQEFKTKFNVFVENWLNDAWIVTLDRDINYRKKRKAPKSNKKS